MNLNNKTFKAITNSSNGEVTEQTIFHFKQTEDLISANYYGGGITLGNLIGTINESGRINMRYHHFNNKGELMTGKSDSRLESIRGGTLLIHDNWQWTSGDCSKGTSTLEEIR